MAVEEFFNTYVPLSITFHVSEEANVAEELIMSLRGGERERLQAAQDSEQLLLLDPCFVRLAKELAVKEDYEDMHVIHRSDDSEAQETQEEKVTET